MIFSISFPFLNNYHENTQDYHENPTLNEKLFFTSKDTLVSFIQQNT